MGYKPLLIGIVFLFSVFSLKSQTVPEIGFSLGATQYIGDLNPMKLFYKPSVAASGEFIYNLNTRTAIRTGISYYTIKGDGYLRYSDRGFDFVNQYFNYHLMYMINFLDYDYSINKDNFTPYFTFGLAYSRVMATNSDAISNVVIPFGPGVRFMYKTKMSFGLEYLINRSFSDSADGSEIQNYGHINDSAPIKSNFNNSDWYSYLCVTITFKFINFGDDCPAYK